MSPRGASVFILVFVFVSMLCGTFSMPSFVSKRLCENCVENKHTNSWDYLLFVNEWPESFCKFYNASHGHDKKAEKKCVIPPSVSTWTIHGTWPKKTGTKGPTSCNNTWQFKLSQIKDLVPVLNKTWPGLLTAKEYWSFWLHEWDNHGTCAASLPVLYGEHNYFDKTLQLKQQHNIDKILSSSGIIPSSTVKYTREKILESVKNATGGMPNLICFQENSGSDFKQYLQEIRMCLDKSLQPFDCPESECMHLTMAYSSPCSSKTPIALPPLTTGNTVV
ncbi:ribonuclease Oy-like [Patiria miniata]|uniref:Uncharacterized protein n=1 Tax=Patiria miniata TaxID=46514 RepID=A0A913ZXD7_PATMI|nr:ribonuclease Oy-like [Patiria miniata]